MSHYADRHKVVRLYKPGNADARTVTQVAFMEDTREQYSEMRDEFFASLEDRRYLSIGEARAKGLKVGFWRLPSVTR